MSEHPGQHLGKPDQTAKAGRVTFVGAGPGDPELLTLKALKALDSAEVVIHDRLVSPEVLALASPKAQIIDAGKQGFGPSTPQAQIDAMLVVHGLQGRHVVRLKSGDATLFGRLDEEIEACLAADIPYSVVPGITSASAAVAGIGQSLTRRGRNASVRLLTGHDMKGFAEQDWRTFAQPGEVAAVYMGKKSSRFLQGRLMMHGAAPQTPVTIVENASRPDQRVVATTLANMASDLADAALNGPALILYGLAPREATELARKLEEIV